MLTRFRRYSKMLILLKQAVYSVGMDSKEEKSQDVDQNDEEKSALEGVLFDINNFSRPKEVRNSLSN